MDQLKDQDSSKAPAAVPPAAGAPVTGIGIMTSLKIEGEPLMIDRVIPGSPAHKAGLKSLDRILEVDDKPTSALTAHQVTEMIRGPKGSSVKVKIDREAQGGQRTELTVTIVRDEIKRALSAAGSPSVTVDQGIAANAALKEFFSKLDLSKLSAKTQKALRDKMDQYAEASRYLWELVEETRQMREDFGQKRDAKGSAMLLWGTSDIYLKGLGRSMDKIGKTDLDGQELDAAEKADPFSDAVLARKALDMAALNIERGIFESKKMVHSELSDYFAKGAQGVDDPWAKFDFAKEDDIRKKGYEAFDKGFSDLGSRANAPQVFKDKAAALDKARAYKLPDSK